MLTLSHPSLQIVRGFAGAVLFSFPMLMTMEMWSLGVSLEPARLMLFITLHLILLAGMASHARHDETVVTRRDAHVETSLVTVDYVAAGSERNAALFFSNDPRHGELTVRAKGYIEP